MFIMHIKPYWKSLLWHMQSRAQTILACDWKESADQPHFDLQIYYLKQNKNMEQENNVPWKIDDAQRMM